MICTCLALVAATVWVPVRPWVRFKWPEGVGPPPYVEPSITHMRGDLERDLYEGRWVPHQERLQDVVVGGVPLGMYEWPQHEWVWQPRKRVEEPHPWASPPRVAVTQTFIGWETLLLSQALILLIGGGLLTWVVRRERRNKAAAS